jgi:LPXTG-motif cell wall-anchored protein
MPSDCGGTVATAVPVMQTPSATSIYFFGDIAASSAVGNSGWLAPSAEVKTLTIVWASYAVLSDVRIALAVKQDPKLPDTGLDVGSTALTGLVLGLLGAAVMTGVRRRRA